MSGPRITDEAVEKAADAYLLTKPTDRVAWRLDKMRAALEAVLPLLAPQQSKTVAEAVAYLRARGEDEAVGTIDTRWAYKRSADYIEITLAPQPVALGVLSDALLIVDGYDVVEGDEVPERELWAVVEAARKVLEGAPQPVDREALIDVVRGFANDPDDPDADGWVFFADDPGDIADAVLALLNGTAK